MYYKMLIIVVIFFTLTGKNFLYIVTQRYN